MIRKSLTLLFAGALLGASAMSLVQGAGGVAANAAGSETYRQLDARSTQLARAWAWQRAIDEGRYANGSDLAKALGVDPSLVSRTMRLTRLSPAIVHRIVINDKGRVVAAGTPAELTAGDGASAVSFDTDTPLDTAAVPVDGLEAVRPLTYRIPTAATPELLATLTTAAAEQGVLIRRLDVDHRNLEEVFLDITGRNLRS